MFYAIYDEDKKRLLTMHAVSSGDLPFTIDSLSSFSDPVIKIGFFASGPVFMTSSVNQIKILFSDRIVKTSNAIGDILLLDKYVNVDNLKIVQVFSGMRVIGDDSIIHPINSERNRV